ncbi:MAG: porin [Burkholderiaceae bacterium]
MKKSLLALAVLGAFAGAAQAQTNVSLYGVVDVGVATGDGGGDDGRLTQLSSGNNAASRWGIKGTEDLGSGLKASFVLENGFDSSDGSGGAGFSRLAYLGLGGAFGEVRLGRQNTLIKELAGDIDPFGAAGMANVHDYFLFGMDQRTPNNITYMTPKFGGFAAAVQYGFGETEGETSDNRDLSLSLGYGNGPLNVQAAYRKQNTSGAIDAGATGDDLDVGFQFGDETFVAGEAFDVDTKDAILGATYNFGVAKLHAMYGQRKIDGLGEDGKFRSGLLGVTVPFGASAIRASYIKTQDREADDADADMFALSYTYALSKRTSFYTTYVRVSNDDEAALGVAGSDYFTPAAGETGDALAIGVTHKF